MDRGEYVKNAIEISPAMNGGYVVMRQRAQYEMNPISEWLAFTDCQDMLAWMVDEYKAANMGPENTNADQDIDRQS